MSEEERILRLENAFAALSEMAVRSQAVDTKHEARLSTLAESNRLIAEMIRRHDERVDEFRAARDETDQKLAALVDAQVRAEEEMSKVRSAQAETDQKIADLVDAQIRHEEAHTRGMEEVRATLAELAGAMKRLSESQAHTDRRLDGLIDIVRELRNGRA